VALEGRTWMLMLKKTELSVRVDERSACIVG
jgi:hypothetical protein